MVVTLLGITIFVKLVQPSNALMPMLVTLSGMVILVKLVQFLNALLPMVVTLFGMVILVKLMQPLNAISGIEVMVVLGNTIDTIWYIPLGMVSRVTPVAKASGVLLVLPEMSRFTFFPAVCSAVSNCVQPLSAVPISPKFICMGRGTGSAVCDEMYWANVKPVGRVSV
jgi:hypothetical protein